MVFTKRWLLSASIVFGGPALSAVSSFSPVVTPKASSAPPSPRQFFLSHFDKSAISPDTAALTYLEINGWLISTGGLTILVDPILEGPLDFGIPAIYSASKRILPSSGLCESLPPIDCLLITQGLDDHAHERTLKKLCKLDRSIPIVAPPSAQGALERSGFPSSNISFIQPGGRITLGQRFGDNSKAANYDQNVVVRATTGALVGPPWQARENGYIISSNQGPSIYIEPHVEYNARELRNEGPVDIIITPISGQGLPAFELVHGPSNALQLVQTLKPSYILPMQNGDVDAKGLVSPIIKSIGTPRDFQQMLKKVQKLEKTKAEIVSITPGKDIFLTC